MPKNIVLCSDGTGNAVNKNRGTNVFKLFEAVDFQDHHADASLPPQIAYYDDGVGTQSLKPLKLLGGAFGWGLSRNVRDLYLELARVYEPGDRIFLFGFSRGAFTVRTLAGLIAHVGVVDRNKVASDAQLQKLVKDAYREIRRCFRRVGGKLSNASENDTRAAEFRRRWSVWNDTDNREGKTPIEFIGVWDTVDAVGFPLDEIADFWNVFIYPFKFPDTMLSPQVRRACHALAIDDERYTFHPTMWDERNETANRIEQVWFAGVHSNVGGGYPKQGLSLISLVWMMDEAAKSGLRFVPAVRQMYNELQNSNDKLYDSRSGLAAYYRYKPRDIGKICADNGLAPKIHISAVERIALGTEGYSPGNLSEEMIVVGDEMHRKLAAASTDAICRGWRDARPLLEHAAAWVRVKAVVQRAFAFSSSVTALFVAARILTDGTHEWSYWSMLKQAALILYGVPWLVALLLALLIFSAWCTGHIHQTYSEFWFPFRPKLRRALLEEESSAAVAR